MTMVLRAVAALLTTVACAPAQQDWPSYGGTAEGTRYSTLKQINRSNVGQLTVVWTYDTGEPGAIQTQPIVVSGVLYANTPRGRAIALDAATGKLIWSFDSKSRGRGARGVTYWAEGKERRILAGFGRYVYALDAGTGEQIETFGTGGRLDLHQDLGRDPETQSVALTSPGVIYKDLLIVGGRESEGLPASPGDVRAYDVRTGKLRWSFHTIPHPGELGYETWPPEAWTYSGAANNWAGMAVDRKRGVVYVPTGSAAADFYGANRVGDNLFANCMIALDAATGKRLWHFQAVKHDLWDRDFPSPPTLVTVKQNGRNVDAVAQTSKQGFVFLFDRQSGALLFPIEPRKYPASTLEGEVASETQVLPTRPAPFARQLLTEDMLTNRTPEAHQWALEQFRTFRSEGQFVPFSVGKDTVMMPGYDGGAEWGGSAFDPESGVLFVNANDLAWTGAMAESQGGGRGGRGAVPLKYRFTGYKRFYDPDGYPAVAPPWGTLNAINLSTGEYAWKVPLGEYPELAAKDTGTENYGGPAVTAGGLVFIGATNYDNKIRAFDKDTGKVLWEGLLPAPGNGTPAVYQVAGRQYVSIAASGGRGPRAGAETPPPVNATYVGFGLRRK